MNDQTLPTNGPAYPPQPVADPPVDPHVTPVESTASPHRSQSQPASGNRKSVQFADKPEISEALRAESDASSPERPRHRHKHSHSRGYEAGDDTDSPLDEQRRGGREHSSRSRNQETTDDGQDTRRNHRRRRSHEPNSSRADPNLNRVVSPVDSDATIELPARFDEKGRKKTEAGEDPLADQLDNILAGKGTAGKVFGNFLDGLFGPDGRRKKSK